MEIVISISEKDYNNIEPFLKGETINGGFNLINVLELIRNGTPLPEKEHKIDVAYICDGTKCSECSKLCRHTTDISHAKSFKPVMFIDEKTILKYIEVTE